MSAPPSNALPAVSLDQWIALNEEMAALVRAGVPLEPALADLAKDLPGRLGGFAAVLSERMRGGEPLAAVLAAEGHKLPPLYRAVVEAGARSGRLPAALEGMAAAARRLADARRIVAGAFLYPLIVALLAWGLFVFVIWAVVPYVAGVLQDFRAPGAGQLAWLADWGRTLRYWAPVPPAAVLLLAGAWWVLSSRPRMMGSRWPAVGLAGVPWLGRMVRWLRAAAFAEVLALLVASRVPLDEGLELAGQASGDPRLAEAARQMAEAVRRGEPLVAFRSAKGAALPGEDRPSAERKATLGPAALPPLLAWLMGAGQARGELAPALRHAAETYRVRAMVRAELVRVALPVLVTLVVGGTATAAFALLVFGPWISMIHALAGT